MRRGPPPSGALAALLAARGRERFTANILLSAILLSAVRLSAVLHLLARVSVLPGQQFGKVADRAEVAEFAGVDLLVDGGDTVMADFWREHGQDAAVG